MCDRTIAPFRYTVHSCISYFVCHVLLSLFTDANPLLKVLYDTVADDRAQMSLREIQHSALMWQRRIRMAIDNLPQMIQEHMQPKQRKSYKILNEFIQQVCLAMFL